VLIRSGRAAESLSGYLGAFEVAWSRPMRSTWRLHALQRLRQRLPGAGHRFQLPDRSGKCKSHRACRQGLRRQSRHLISKRRRARAAKLRSRCSTWARSLASSSRSRRKAISRRGAIRSPRPRRGQLAQMVGEFEKPKFFAYNAKICAHSRSAQGRLQQLHRHLFHRRDFCRR